MKNFEIFLQGIFQTPTPKYEPFVWQWAKTQELGEFKSGVASDGVSQFLAQSALLLIVGQLQQIETSRRGRQAADWVATTNVEEPFQHTTDRVASVLQDQRTTPDYSVSRAPPGGRTGRMCIQKKFLTKIFCGLN